MARAGSPLGDAVPPRRRDVPLPGPGARIGAHRDPRGDHGHRRHHRVSLETFRGPSGTDDGIAAPGRAEELLRESFRQAAATTSSRWLTFALALVVTFVGGMFAMAQFERGCNRIYGVQDRRPGGRRFGRASCSA
jgi:hypothetical protein